MTLHNTTSTIARRIFGREAAEMDEIRTRATQVCDRRTVAGSDSQQVIARAFRFCIRSLPAELKEHDNANHKHAN